MIIKMTGILVAADEGGVVLEREGISYAIFVPAFTLGTLAAKIGQTVTFHTIQYFEGSAVGGNIYPRMIGFLDQDDRSFFNEFVKVKGLGNRKALRALAMPIRQIASAIERGDVRELSTLPEIGKRTAEQMVASLRGKLDQFTWSDGTPATGEPMENLNQTQREALEVLLQLGEKRPEAVELIDKVCRTASDLTDPAKIVEAVYRRKAGIL